MSEPMTNLPILRIMFVHAQRMGPDTSTYATPSKVRIEALPCGGVILRPLVGDAWMELVDRAPGSSEKRKAFYIVKVEREGIASRAYEVGEAASGPPAVITTTVLTPNASPVTIVVDENATEPMYIDSTKLALSPPPAAPYTPVVGVVKQKRGTGKA